MATINFVNKFRGAYLYFVFWRWVESHTIFFKHSGKITSMIRNLEQKTFYDSVTLNPLNDFINLQWKDRIRVYI